MIKAASADCVEIEVALGCKMHDRIDGRREDIHTTARIPQVTQRRAIESERSIAELAQDTQAIGKVKSDTTLHVPSVIQVPSGISDRLRETTTQFKGKVRNFLRTQSTNAKESKTSWKHNFIHLS